MARTIRDDFEGVVHVPDAGLVLKAGDEEPEGFTLGAHLFAESSEPDNGTDGKPAGNASTEVWQDYARSKGATDADLEGKSRDDLRDAYGN